MRVLRRVFSDRRYSVCAISATIFLQQMKGFIYETKNSLSRIICRSSDHFWICGVSGPVFTGIPGIKLGLANLAVLFILDRYSVKEAALVSVVRILVIGFMFGNLFSILYSLAGAALSLTVMDLLKKHSGFSLIGISVAGGVTHNIGQLIVAMIVVSNTSLMVYAPALLVAGVLAGILIGGLTKEVVGRLPLNL